MFLHKNIWTGQNCKDRQMDGQMDKVIPVYPSHCLFGGGGIILYRQPNTNHGMHFLMMSVTQPSKTNHFAHLKIMDGYHCC